MTRHETIAQRIARCETREQRRARRQRMAAAVRVAVVLAILALLGFGCTSALAAEQLTRGDAYLASLGADNATRAIAAAQWDAWRHGAA